MLLRRILFKKHFAPMELLSLRKVPIYKHSAPMELKRSAIRKAPTRACRAKGLTRLNDLKRWVSGCVVHYCPSVTLERRTRDTMGFK